MNITPTDIRTYTFQKEFRGYQKEAVEGYLYALSNDWAEMIEDNKILKAQLEVSEKELNRLKELERVMYKAMKDTDDKASVIVEEASSKAEKYYVDKVNEADGILMDAEKDSKQMLDRTNSEIRILVDEAKEVLIEKEKEFHSLDLAKQRLLDDMRSLLAESNAKLTDLNDKFSPNHFDAKKQLLSDLAPAEEINIETKTHKQANASKQKNAKQLIQTEPDGEDDGLPTVKKILASEGFAEKNTVLPTDSNASFFDKI
jgi:cell division initiation protein